MTVKRPGCFNREDGINLTSPERAFPNLHGDPNAAPRCGARTRAGGVCRQPAMPNGRCRLHGGKSTGPRTAEGLRRSRTARLVHGRYSGDRSPAVRYLRMIARLIRPVLDEE